MTQHGLHSKEFRATRPILHVRRCQLASGGYTTHYCRFSRCTRDEDIGGGHVYGGLPAKQRFFPSVIWSLRRATLRQFVRQQQAKLSAIQGTQLATALINAAQHRFEVLNAYPQPLGRGKAPFVNFSVSKIFDLSKIPVGFFASHSYLTGVTEAEPRQYPSNINVIFNS